MPGRPVSSWFSYFGQRTPQRLVERRRLLTYDPRMGHGFWSYVRKDDAAMHGAIRRLAEHIKEEYELLSGGEELSLFFDSASLKWGDDWRAEISQALEATTFFIPIVTPRYFKSDECRRELLGFWEKATELGLQGLIMPLYFADVPAIEEKMMRIRRLS
jgi:TIR domain-containing protein